MQGEIAQRHIATSDLIRVRVDVAGIGLRADLAISASLPVAELIPELVAIFDDKLPESQLRNTGFWRLRLSSGIIADPETNLLDLGVTSGHRLMLVDDPGPIPPPAVVDVADILAEDQAGTGIADTLIGTVTALFGSICVISAALFLAESDFALASAAMFCLFLLAAGGLRIAFRKHAPETIINALALQTLLFASSTGACFVGVPLSKAATEWSFALSIGVPLLIVAVLIVALGSFLSDSPRISLNRIGAAATNIAVLAIVYSLSLALFSEDRFSASLAVTAGVAIISLLLSPTIAITFAGVRIPYIPVAGEPFDLSDDPNSTSHTVLATRSGSLLDGLVLGSSLSLAASTISLLLCTPPTADQWAIALCLCVFILLSVQSRGHARFVASFCTAISGASVLLALAFRFWVFGVWPVALMLSIPLIAATALPALPAARITPTVRRLLEFSEAIAIALSFPLIAIAAGALSAVQGWLQ